MHITHRLPSIITLAAIGTLGSYGAFESRAYAGGYFSGTKGARAAGRAGAFVAKADDLSAVELNPAGLARIGTTLIQVGNRFSSNYQLYSRASILDWSNTNNLGTPKFVEFDPVQNSAPWQLLDPMIGVATNFGLKNWGFAISAYSPAGISKEQFPVDGPQKYMMVSREVQILYYTASAAWKHKDKFGVGATFQWIDTANLKYQIVVDGNTFADTVNPVSSNLDMLATLKGKDHFGFGAIVGAWYHPTPNFQLALSGQLVPENLNVASKLSISPVSPDFEGEIELHREGDPANDVTLTLPLPLVARLGLRYIFTKKNRQLFDLELDASYESWSRVKDFEIDGNGLVAEVSGQKISIDKIAIPKQWQDTFSVRLGGDIHVLPKHLDLRAGVSYESSAAKPAFANVDFFTGQQIGASAGASVRFAGFEIALAYNFLHQPLMSVREDQSQVFQQVPGSPCKAPFTEPNVCNEHFLGKPSAPANAGTYRARYHSASIDLLYRF